MLAVTFAEADVELDWGSSDSSGHPNRVPVESGSVVLLGVVTLTDIGVEVSVGSKGRDVIGVDALAEAVDAPVRVVFGHKDDVAGIDTPRMLLWVGRGKMVAFGIELEVTSDGGTDGTPDPVPGKRLDVVMFGKGNGGGTDMPGRPLVTGGKVIVVFWSVIGGRGAGRMVREIWMDEMLGERVEDDSGMELMTVPTSVPEAVEL